jgi:phosphatidylglycerophosphate synthase
VTPGEAWTRDVLRELRAGGYRLRAWQRFLARSFERARATRRVRRREHRQVLLVGVAGIAVWVAVAAFRPWLALAGALWWLPVIAMLDWHLGMLENDRGRPLRRLGLPNLLSLARAAVVPVLPLAPPALLSAILIPAGLTDAIDGPLARRRGEETRLGRWLDGTADTLALSAASVGAARHGLLPWWAVTLVLGRQALPWLAVSFAYFRRGAAPSPAGAFSGKATGVALFAGLALASLHLPGGVPLVVLGSVAGIATFGTTIARAFRLQPAA